MGIARVPSPWEIMRKTTASALLAILLWSPTAALAETGTAQLGGDYAATISCGGAKLKATRLGDREVNVTCKADSGVAAAASVQLVSSDDRMQLASGDEVVLRCAGKKLAVRRQTGTVVLASCVPIAARSV